MPPLRSSVVRHPPAAAHAHTTAAPRYPGCRHACWPAAQSLQQTDSFMGFITPYRIDIVQGNVVTTEQAALLKPGLTRLQVRDVLGSPLIADPFHADRWDYVFTMRRPEHRRRSGAAWSSSSKATCVESRRGRPSCPREREFVASISRNRDLKVPKLELTDEERKALPPPVQPRGAAGRAGGAAARVPAAGSVLKPGRADAEDRRRRRLRPHGPHADRGRARQRRLPPRRRAGHRRQPGAGPGCRRLPRPAHRCASSRPICARRWRAPTC